MTNKQELRFNIAAVERDTGVSKDVLRVWERRYGFPTPERDAHGERLYPVAQVEQLRLVKRLLDQGHRPGKLLATPQADLVALSAAHRSPAPTKGGVEGEADLDALLSPIRQHDAQGFAHAMQLRLARQGLQRFVQDTVAPLTLQVGLAWEQGRIQVFEEHLFTELTRRALRQAVDAVAGGREPRVLLTSVPDEPHGLGLLMVEALLALEGAHCIPLGTQMPLLEIAEAARAHRAEIVALSFSSAFPSRQVPALLQQLRGLLAYDVDLWAGGEGVPRGAMPDDVCRIADLGQVGSTLKAWREARA